MSYCHTVYGSEFCLTTQVWKFIPAGVGKESQVHHISEPAPVRQSLSIGQNLDQFLKVKHLGRHT